ncbi:hypothetical protein CO057_00720 [Candidatus Uhrbacteria bacterium CG_4_9_14_0_2_um_filter_41_50]|uniref:Uncharacterized protein n=1 Tax=Candidatus Uhrbacteria bacterium CG_4_9_14_0_2_um_filter_41_50 TaxID=1975031 RepID=A0A2M8EQ41_9BACT|nr:hypothetical protein [Candidatus Magasanikbacteria bacterium]PIX62303.1 MAG: hypothetical protein COZ45_02125 [Candidatus Uhrbacteria bacterium CG_4_10_14_3_um_filter_41_21]PIZ54687.1 MAG: hypothetical protein COY24_02875 [Candidatus Uhrbacteria bacterium CG_4_10_14_0_2_um_filter_41_21]PJB84754.1 MAG: hypothetical protein CO086_02040 [Candidatus Uhrbacteria bacterium CG_4_9_14_0_8_um_filter_41_16]PJC24856.1 MAG: hypothetical protein CO057_00720 [Candidatus Uhrbacteria bacterium CG_4_9_14_0_2
MKNLRSLLVLIPFLLMGLGCRTEEGEDISYEDDVFPLVEEIDRSSAVRGSCNIIDASSTCIDYIGSIWTDQQMELNCSSVGTFSKNSCPYGELGGCLNTPGTISEDVIWFYPYGGEAFSVEDAYYARMVCDALDISNWTTPDALFLTE